MAFSQPGFSDVFFPVLFSWFSKVPLVTFSVGCTLFLEQLCQVDSEIFIRLPSEHLRTFDSQVSLETCVDTFGVLNLNTGD